MSVEIESILSSQIIPLHLVAGSTSPYGYFMAKALLERGSDPNARSPDGLSPVHVAASWGNYEILKLLLLNGGNPWLEDDDGKTALDLARQENHLECVQLLTWWLKNAEKDSKPSTRTTVVGNSPQQSPSDYRPKYFSSPFDSPKTPTSTGRGPPIIPAEASPRTNRTPIRNDGPSRIHSSTSRRILNYESGSQSNKKDSTDGNSLDGFHSALSRRLSEINGLTSPVQLIKARSEASQLLDHLIELPVQALESENIDVKADPRSSFLQEELDAFSQRLDETLKLGDDGKKQALAILETTIIEENEEIDPKHLSACNKLTDIELRCQATNQGMDVGPITPGTRLLYVRRLAGLLTAQKSAGGDKKYLPELQAAINGQLDVAKCRQEELHLRASFDSPLNGIVKKWREGHLKMSFCYLLLDPTITDDLPSRASTMTESQRLQTFVNAIFYVGKGKKSRPFQHLLEAARQNSEIASTTPKSRRILDLWNLGHGVISLHVFQNIIPVEAYTREAAMIEAIGLHRLCNVKRGDYYGAAANWALGRRRGFGAYLLQTAAAIFILEGEKQLKREDVLNMSS